MAVTGLQIKAWAGLDVQVKWDKDHRAWVLSLDGRERWMAAEAIEFSMMGPEAFVRLNAKVLRESVGAR